MAKRGKKPGQFTAQQQLFVAAYVSCRNATKAARTAGYASPGDSGYQLMHEPEYQHVRFEVERQLAEVIGELKKWRNILLSRALQLAMFDLTKVLGDDGKSLLPLEEIDPEDRACISAITVKEYEGGQSVTAKGNSPAPYLKLLFQASGLLGQQTEDTSKTEAEIEEELRGRFSQLAEEVFPSEPPPEPEPEQPQA